MVRGGWGVKTEKIYEAVDEMLRGGAEFSFVLTTPKVRRKWSEEELVRLREAFAPPPPVQAWVGEYCFELSTIKLTKDVKI